MKLKFNVHMGGHAHTWERGETYEITDPKEAARLIKAGYASAVGETGSPTPRRAAETATKVLSRAETRAAAAKAKAKPAAAAKKPAAKTPAKK